MMWDRACLMPYIGNGDVRQCWIKRDHRGTCEEANRMHRLLVEEHMSQAEISFAIWLDDDTRDHRDDEGRSGARDGGSDV